MYRYDKYDKVENETGNKIRQKTSSIARTKNIYRFD